YGCAFGRRRTHRHALATPSQRWSAHPSPSESWTDTDVHLSIFVTFRIRTDSDGYSLGCDWSANENYFQTTSFPESHIFCFIPYLFLFCYRVWISRIFLSEPGLRPTEECPSQTATQIYCRNPNRHNACRH